jgi:hypothetical protein
MAWPKFGGKDKEEDKPPESKTDIDALVERLGASIDERIKPLRDDFNSLKTDWETIKAEASKPTARTNEDGSPVQPTEEERAKNERRAAIGIAIQANARMTESEVLAELGEQWGHLAPTLRDYFAQTPLDRKALPDYPQYCRNVLNMEIGKAARAAGLRYDGQNKSFFLEDKSTSATREEGPLSDPSLIWHQQKPDGTVKTWSVADQLAVLKIDPKELAENMKKGIV